MRKISNEELNRLSPDEFKGAEKTPLIIVLDNVRSLNNVGSVFRTADAFLLEAVYLCGITGKPPHREIQKTALGATETVDWKYFDKTTDAVLFLEQNEYNVYAVEQVKDAVMLSDFLPDKNKKIALVFGSEVGGVSEDVIKLCDASIEIPQLGTKHSLNISVSAGIVVWEIFNKIKA